MLRVTAPGQITALIGLAFVAFSALEGWRARTQRHARAGQLLAASFFIFAVGVLCYPIPLARAIDRVFGIVDLAHLMSMVAVTTTLQLLYRLTTELTDEAHVPLRTRIEQITWALLAGYVGVWTSAHLATHLTEDLIYDGYYAWPPLIGALNALAGVILAIAGACAFYGFWTMPKPTRAERITACAIEGATLLAFLYGAAICTQVALSAFGQPQSIHRFMIPLGLTGVALALLSSAVFTDGLRLTSWTHRLSRPESEASSMRGPVNDLIRMTIFLDDRMLAAWGAVRELLNVVDGLCQEHGLDEERTKLTLQATRVGFLDRNHGAAPYDRTIHQMCHFARRNDRFIGNVYRIALATLGSGALPLGEEMPPIEPWHEELAGIIREAVYRYYGHERGRCILANQGIVPAADVAL